MLKKQFGKTMVLGLRLGIASLAAAGVFLHPTPAHSKEATAVAATDDAHTTGTTVVVWGTSGNVATVTVGGTTTSTGTTGGGGGGSDPNGNPDEPNPCESSNIGAGSAGVSTPAGYLPPKSFSDAQAMVAAKGGVHTTRDSNLPAGSFDAAIPHTNKATGDLWMPFDPMLNGPAVFTTPQAGIFNTGGYGQTWLGLANSGGFNVAGPPPMSEADARELIYFHELYHIMNPGLNHPSGSDGGNLRILAAFDASGNITSTDGGALALYAAAKNPGNPAGFQQTLIAAGVNPAKAMAVTAKMSTPCNTGS